MEKMLEKVKPFSLHVKHRYQPPHILVSTSGATSRGDRGGQPFLKSKKSALILGKKFVCVHLSVEFLI